MLELSWGAMLGPAMIVTLAYAVYGLTGFGAVIVGLPLLAHFFSLRFAVPMMLVFDVCTGLLLGLKYRHQADWSEIKRLLPFLLLGMAIGVPLLAFAPERWLILGLGLFVLGYASWSLLSQPNPVQISPRWVGLTGLVGGAFTALYGTGGPIYAIYLARRIELVHVLRATLGLLIFGTALARLLMFAGSGFYAQQGLLALAFILLPCALAGYFLGARLHTRIELSLAKRIIWLLLLASGLNLVLRSWSTS